VVRKQAPIVGMSEIKWCIAISICEWQICSMLNEFLNKSQMAVSSCWCLMVSARQDQHVLAADCSFIALSSTCRNSARKHRRVLESEQRGTLLSKLV